MHCIAPDLLQVWQEEASSVMIDEYVRVINYLFVESVGDLKTKLGIFPRPKMGIKAIGFLKYALSNY